MNYNRHGCPLVLVNFEAKQALEIIQEEKVSAFLGITTMINWMMAVPNFGSYDLSSLRNFQYGGGPMPSSVVRAAMDAFPCTMIQGYGQTEGAGMTFLSQEDHLRAVAGDHPERLRSCGREGFTAQIRVVDEFGRDVFIVDRAKDMIISGGENIYCVQVEEAINQHPAVLECAVFGIPDEVWGEAVKAVVVLKPGTEATEQDVIDEAKKHLASYQKPRSVDFVAQLPKAPTGKILKRELRTPYWADRD